MDWEVLRTRDGKRRTGKSFVREMGSDGLGSPSYEESGSADWKCVMLGHGWLCGDSLFARLSRGLRDERGVAEFRETYVLEGGCPIARPLDPLAIGLG